MKTLGFIFRNTRDFQQTDALKSLYFSFVQSRLEYGAIIWHPVYGKYIDALENIQRKFAKFLIFKCDGVYPNRGCEHEILLERTNLPSLSSRRNYLLTSFLTKVCSSYIDCQQLLEQVDFHVPSRSVREVPVFNISTESTNFFIKMSLYTTVTWL